MADDDTFSMEDAFQRCKEQGLLQTKPKPRPMRARRTSRLTAARSDAPGRTSQVNLKVTPAFAEYLRREAHKRGLGVSQFVEQTMMGAKR